MTHPDLQILIDMISESPERMDDLDWLIDNGLGESRQEAEMWDKVRPARAESARKAVAFGEEFYARQRQRDQTDTRQ